MHSQVFPHAHFGRWPQLDLCGSLSTCLWKLLLVFWIRACEIVISMFDYGVGMDVWHQGHVVFKVT